MFELRLATLRPSIFNLVKKRAKAVGDAPSAAEAKSIVDQEPVGVQDVSRSTEPNAGYSTGRCP